MYAGIPILIGAVSSLLTMPNSIMAINILINRNVLRMENGCLISRNELNNFRGVITAENDLLHTTRIPSYQILLLSCPYKNNQAIMCVDGKWTKDNESREIAFPTCGIKRMPETCPFDDLVADVTQLRSEDNCPAKLLIVGYSTPHGFLEVYRSCYDVDNYIPLFSQAYIYPQLEPDMAAGRPRCSFSLDGQYTGLTGNIERYLSTNEYMLTFDRLYGSMYMQHAADRRYRLVRGHLVPSGDMLTFAQKAATFKMLNVVPQFQGINNGNWKRVEQWVQKLTKLYTRLLVQTGSYGVLRPGNGVEAKLYNDQKLPVPKWIYKLVSTEHQSPIYAFITSNNPFDVQDANNPTDLPSFCIRITCPGDLRLHQIPHMGITYCCEPRLFSPYR